MQWTFPGYPKIRTGWAPNTVNCEEIVNWPKTVAFRSF